MAIFLKLTVSVNVKVSYDTHEQKQREEPQRRLAERSRIVVNVVLYCIALLDQLHNYK